MSITQIKMDISSPEEQTLTILQNGVEIQYNMVQLLRFRENLVEEMAMHASNQSYWEQSAIDLEFKRMEFEESGYAIWWTHARRYAKYYATAANLKETLESVKDCVISLFSENVPEDERLVLIEESFRGFLLGKHGTQKKVDDFYSDAENRQVYADDLAKFTQHALMFQKEGWSYEKIEATKRNLMEMAKRMGRFASTYGERAFKMKEVADHDLAKYGNISSQNQLSRYNTQESRPPSRASQPPADYSPLQPLVNTPTVVSTPSQKTFCNLCGQLQFMTPAGITCPNGHGGADSYPDPFQPDEKATNKQTPLTTTSKRRMNMPKENK